MNPPRQLGRLAPLPLGQGHKAAAAGIEPASGRLTAAYPYQHGSHRKIKVRTAGFEPAISCARGTRNPRLSHVLKNERPAGIEPALPPWQGSRLPLHHGRLSVTTKLSNSESTGPDSNRRHRITGAESWPLDDQCLLSVGPEGLEPSPARLRAGNAAANTLVLGLQLARWELNPRPASYKDAALTAELRASVE